MEDLQLLHPREAPLDKIEQIVPWDPDEWSGLFPNDHTKDPSMTRAEAGIRYQNGTAMQLNGYICCSQHIDRS